jgi:undecaprenyl-diphosphatase
MHLLQTLMSIDASWFHKINGQWTSGLFDQVMPWVTDIENTKWYLLGFIALMFLRGGLKTFLILLGCVVAVGLTDFSASHFIKPVVNRPRPSISAPPVRLLVPIASGESFPSNHAANVFAGARFLSYYFPEFSLLMGLVALIVSYSRIYVGVHFPLDVIGGAIWGTLCAWIIHWSCSEISSAWYRWRLPSAPNRIQAEAIRNRKKRRRDRA